MKSFYGLLVPLSTMLSLTCTAQVPCATPPSCIVDNTLQGEATGDLNSGGATNLNGWFVSHGTPSLFGNDCPSNASGCSIWMWSYSGTGEGVITCYDFRPGVEVDVCMWVRNTNAINNGGRLQVWMANGVTVQENSVTPPVITNGVLINDTWTNDQDWGQLSFSVTPQAAFSQLVIFPLMTAPPTPDNLQYELQIDDIRVSPRVSTFDDLTMEVVPSEIAWCDTARLCVRGAPAGSTITWSPAAGLSSTTGPCVSASPCADTPYSASVSAPGGCPNACTPTITNGTVTGELAVVPPTVSVFQEGPAICGEAQVLVALATNELCGTGDWNGPNGPVSSTDSLVVDPLTPGNSGPWTYRITHPSGTCTTDAARIIVDTKGTTASHFLPNAFSPDGDGINDRFFPQSAYGFSSYALLLFDRWGRLLRTVTSDGWDGTANGEPLPNDIYAWRAEYVLACDTKIRRANGHVMVLR